MLKTPGSDLRVRREPLQRFNPVFSVLGSERSLCPRNENEPPPHSRLSPSFLPRARVTRAPARDEEGLTGGTASRDIVEAAGGRLGREGQGAPCPPELQGHGASQPRGLPPAGPADPGEWVLGAAPIPVALMKGQQLETCVPKRVGSAPSLSDSEQGGLAGPQGPGRCSASQPCSEAEEGRPVQKEA